jgi:hypothetical protein
MSDYNPNSYDRYGNAGGPHFEPPDPDGKGPYVLLAILVLIGLVGGLLYFNGPPKGTETAQAPAVTRTVPAPSAMPSPATPTPMAPSATGTTTAPTNPPAETTKQ